MKKNNIWKYMIIIGLIPFIIPIVWALYSHFIENTWGILDFVIMYSYVYWITYIIGIGFIIIAVILKKKSH